MTGPERSRFRRDSGLPPVEKFVATGAIKFAGAFDPADWFALVAELPPDRPGLRLYGLPQLRALLGPGSSPQAIASSLLGALAFPVRAILFDKSATNNWPLGWHQDRTVAVKTRADAAGYGPWSIKGGVAHVEPPFAVIEAMVTLRLHLDPVDADNAPLRIAPGSHRLGKLLEADYDATVAECGEQICTADAGDIWAYSTAILHASAAAQVPRQRQVVQIDYATQDLAAPLLWAGVYDD
jgi:Phytanoyl-CoA dioxygenase (PhyH)